MEPNRLLTCLNSGGGVRFEICGSERTIITASMSPMLEGVWRAEEQLPPRPRSAEPTTKPRKLSAEPTGVLHCLSCVTALKGEHATHCGEPDCSGVIDQLPGVIPRYRAAETNAGRNTRNLLSQAGSRRQGESSSLPQAKPGNTGRGMELFCTSLTSPNTRFKLRRRLWTRSLGNRYQGVFKGEPI